MVVDCESTRYAPSKPCSEDRVHWCVVYFNSKGEEMDSHPACFLHGLAEVDRHYASAGMVRCELREAS